MNNKPIEILKDRVEKQLLPMVQAPARYIGGEINQIKKNLKTCDYTIALCFPDIYEIAMSHTGMAILYAILNKMPSVAAERTFSPWTDAEEIMRSRKIPLFTLESKAAAGDFDMLGFSINNELCYTTILNMLDLAGIPLRSADRTEDHPLVVVGSITAACAEPIADFTDIFVLGDGEKTAPELVDLLKHHKKQGTLRKDTLLAVAKSLPFAYVPSLYTYEYEDEKIKSFKPLHPDIPTTFTSATVDDFDKAPVPTAPIVPFVEPVHERISIEIMRGCPGRCRFCQASFCKRPLRFRSVERIVEIAKQNYKATAFDTIGLLSLSTADYPHLGELIEKLQQYFIPKHVGISLPSLRVKEQLQILPKLAASVRKSGLTIAVEAAAEKLRRIINKPITDEDLLAGILAAYEAGYKRVKLYFMVGFPSETEEDIKQIVHLSNKIARLKKSVDNRVADVTAAISWLVPKPHTPFAWLGQKESQYFENAKKLILDEKRNLNARYLRFNFHNIERSVLESAIGRGDRKMSNVIETAFRSGARFDLWGECFDYNIWAEAFKANDMEPNKSAQKSFAPQDILPWQHLAGPKKEYLLDHYNKAMEEAKTELTD